MASSSQRTPPGTPPSPSASLYAQSDDEENEYNTIRHAKTGKGVKLLYSKSKVYVHPTPSAKDNIPGFIALIRQRGSAADQRRMSSSSTSSKSASAASLLLAWVPESSLGEAYDTYVKVDLSGSSLPPKQSYLVPPPPTTSSHSSSLGAYSFAVPVSEVYSLLVRPPSIGWWFGSLVINTRAGDSFPALFFHDSECESTILQRKKLTKETFDPFSDGGGVFWGGDEVLRWLKQYVNVERSKQDMSIYLLDPTEADRLGFESTKDLTRRNVKQANEKAKEKAPASGATRDAAMDPLTKTLKEARWHFLEKLSQVTTFTRRTAQAVADNPRVPPQVKRLMQNPEVVTLQEEFDSARLYLARWAMGIAEQSEREKRQRIWTARDVLEMEESEVGEFEILDMQASNLSLADKRRPVSLSEWNGFFDPRTGTLQVTVDEVKNRIFHGGLNADDGVRKEAWLFLLGVYDWNSSSEDRKDVMHYRRDEYIRLKGAWWERMAEGTGTLEEAEWWKDQRMRIEKDVHRTDRNVSLFAGEDIPHPDPDSPFAEVGTNVHLEQMKDMLLTYNEYNKDLGYVQGMSDLLAPIYAVMQDDAVAFGGFVGFMERMERNFLRDQSGMRKQLLTLDHLVQLMDPKLYVHLQKADSTNFFFFFRMLLVWFKRELVWTDVLRLWEILWTDQLSSNYHLFIALAILEKHRNVMMDHLHHFDEVLKYVNELANTIDLPSTLLRAEGLFRRFQRTVEAIDRKQNFPAPNVRPRKRPTQPTLNSSGSPQSTVDEEGQISAKAPVSAAPLATVDAHSSSTSQTNPPRMRSKQTRPAGTGPATTPPTTAPTEELDEVPKPVISAELRELLSRKPVKLDKKEIKEHGGGVN